MVTLVTGAQNCHVQFVTCGHTCHMWPDVVTLVTCGHSCHKISIFHWLSKKCIRCPEKTRPMYRPAWPQVKTLASRLEIEAGVISSVSGTCVPGGPHNSYQISPHPEELRLEPIGVRFDR